MKNKGFTLIELLAVIVILAIIALIATPIILNIIDDVRVEGNKRSIDNYAKAVENAVARYQLNNKEAISGSFTLSTDENKPRTLVNAEGKELEIEYDGEDVVCTTIEITQQGHLYLAGCKVNEVEVDYTYGVNQISCTLDDKDTSGGVSLSDEVTCGEDKFYVMSNSGNTVTMLAEYGLDLTTNKQSETAGKIAFSTSDYWYQDSNYTGYDSASAAGTCSSNIPSGYSCSIGTGYYSGYSTCVHDENVYGEAVHDENGYWVYDERYDMGCYYGDSEYDWANGYKPAGASVYPYVYDSNSNLYLHVEAYETYLKNNGVSSADAKLMSYEQAIELGCSQTGWTGCSSVPSWVRSTSNYWLGSVYDYMVWDIALFGDAMGNNSTNIIRPVVTISISQINKN